MEKKTVLITGASGAIGTAVAQWFMRDYRLILHYANHKPSIEKSKDVFHVKADFRCKSEISEMMDGLNRKFGGVDILINNAGVTRSAVSWKVKDEDWEDTLAVNLTAPFLVIRKVIPHMRSTQYGRIINVSSVVAQSGHFGTSAYAASKAGLFGLTKTLSKELASFNITVNALALGYFESGMITKVPTEQLERLKEAIPLGKFGAMDTVCKTLEWLLSDEAGYVTGQVINLNGGLLSS